MDVFGVKRVKCVYKGRGRGFLFAHSGVIGGGRDVWKGVVFALWGWEWSVEVGEVVDKAGWFCTGWRGPK